MLGTLLELCWAGVKIVCLAFGGGMAAIPLLEAEAVPRWMSPQEFGDLVGLNCAFPGISILKLAGVKSFFPGKASERTRHFSGVGM
jgi:chromate transport protein ChrA